jgi:hypothetical protein
MHKNRKIILVSFATNDLKRSIVRLKAQAENSNYYNQIKIITPNDLSDVNKDKINFLLKQGKTRGYAYWYWKPLILLDLFKGINEGDIIHYLDVGFHINKTLSNRFKEYLDLLHEDDRWLLAFQYKNINDRFPNTINLPKREEYKYTKADLFHYFDCIDDKKITHTAQFSAGNFLIKKHKNSIFFLTKWIEVFEKNFELIDDTPSNKENFPNFLENRHDQSVFSILCKKNFIGALSAYECDWAEKDNKRTWAHILDYPFLAKRDLEYNIFKRFINRQIKNFKRKRRIFFNN